MRTRVFAFAGRAGGRGQGGSRAAAATACLGLMPLWLLSLVFAAEPPPPPEAPAEMRSFAFLLGEWGCNGSWRTAEAPRAFEATWRAREVLDGHVIIEEYRSFWPNGETFVYGTNFRTYDAANERWAVRWQSALDSTAFDLGQPEFSHDAAGSAVIRFLIKSGSDWQRATYRDITTDHFTWQGDASADAGRTWDEAFMVIDCTRAGP